MLPTMSEGWEIDLSDFVPENATLKGDYLWYGVEIVIEGVPTVLEVGFMYLYMSIGRVLLQRSVSTKLFDPMRHHMDRSKVEVGIRLLGNIYLVADVILPGVHFAPILGCYPRFHMCFLIYLSLLHKFCSHGIRLGLHLSFRHARVTNLL